MEQFETIFQILKASLWGTVFTGNVTENDYLEMQKHAITPLVANKLDDFEMAPALKKRWKEDILRHVSYGVQYRYCQSHLSISVPYVILKGTSSAQYYPYPELRTLGDIDLMPSRTDFEVVCNELINDGFVEITSKEKEERGRHRCFKKLGILIEVHAFFAVLLDPEKAKLLDDLILDNLTPSHLLPDEINGLVLLEHIYQHLEAGLGLRQILDWMMYVDKCLTDEKWLVFKQLARNVGLEKLAIAITRMCEIYLGLAERQWCNKAKDDECRQLMEYVMECGNFGNKMHSEEDISKNVFTLASTPKATFRLLQERGQQNWKAVRKCSFLKYFAWIYQAGRYGFRGLRRKGAVSKIKNEYFAAKKRRTLFEALDVKQGSKGMIFYINGKYIKK